jgi:hypothetical protein
MFAYNDERNPTPRDGCEEASGKGSRAKVESGKLSWEDCLYAFSRITLGSEYCGAKALLRSVSRASKGILRQVRGEQRAML